MDYLIRILNDSITGIIYFAALFFFFLRYIKAYKLDFIKEYKDVMLYSVVLVVFFSRIISGIAESIVSNIITMIYPGIATDIYKTINAPSIPQNILDQKTILYSALVFYRHLFFSTLLLGISLLVWFRDKVNKRRTFFITLIILSIILLSYFFTRQSFIPFRDAINNKFAH